MDLFTRDFLDAARGIVPADAVFSGADIFNPFTCSWERGSLAVKNGRVLGTGDYTGKTEYDFSGAYIVPGLIDAHVHIESSLIRPGEYARLVAIHGTSTVIADPHEIANVAGVEGIRFMLEERRNLPVDIRYLLPSCVPATPADAGGAILEAVDLAPFVSDPGILGLAEMMNVPGVLNGDSGIRDKLALSKIRDGHAPLLTGKDLNAYILAGLQSDHECTSRAEADEKLRKGMYIYIREGSTEHNIEELIQVVTSTTVSRCCFATDDCHADLLAEDGHIDRCIRKAITCGLAPELAIRMATLSAAERFGLTDRGALSPGRMADFCIIDDPETFVVKKVFRGGLALADSQPVRNANLPPTFHCTTPTAESIAVSGSGNAWVIGLVPHQILTEALNYEVSSREIPDLTRDILKVVVVNRYREKPCGVGLVHGFLLKKGALACSISHDTHNIVAVGTSDDEIRRAISEVIQSQGAMAAVTRTETTVLPLDCAGLMSSLPYPEVVERLKQMHAVTERMGGIEDPFMYLSFLALTVIPALRITDRGLFDVLEFRDVPLFTD